MTLFKFSLFPQNYSTTNYSQWNQESSYNAMPYQQQMYQQQQQIDPRMGYGYGYSGYGSEMDSGMNPGNSDLNWVENMGSTWNPMLTSGQNTYPEMGSGFGRGYGQMGPSSTFGNGSRPAQHFSQQQQQRSGWGQETQTVHKLEKKLRKMKESMTRMQQELKSAKLCQLSY